MTTAIKINKHEQQELVQSTDCPKYAGATVLISHGFQPDYEAGFANGLSRNGIKVTLIASDQTLYKRLDSRIKVHNLRGSQNSKRSVWRKMVNLLWYWTRLIMLVAHRHPVTHLTGLFSLSNFSTTWADKTWEWECRCLRFLSNRLILTVHNVVPHDRDTPEVRRYLSVVYRIPHILIVHTENACQRLIDEFDIDRSKIRIMGHGLDEIIYPKVIDVAATRIALGYEPDQRFILFLGSVRRYKGVDLLLQAVRHLDDDVHVLVAGNCIDAKYQQEIEQIIEQWSLKKKVTLELGYLTEERVSQLLGAADVLVMPYRKIDQSGVLFAALRHGLPVIAFDVGNLRDYLPNGVGKIVAVGDIGALADAINSSEFPISTRNLIATYAEQFRWEETVKAILHVYRERLQNEKVA
jgi:glycosyltransferase involved in cell wall biosynthesis